MATLLHHMRPRVASGWLAVVCAAFVFATSVVPLTAHAGDKSRQDYALRQAGSHGRNDHDYGKGRGDVRRGHYDRYDRRAYDYRYDGRRHYDGHDRRRDYDRHDDRRGRDHRYYYPSQQHYSYVAPPVYRHRPAVYSYRPGYYRPPVHVVRRPPPRYTTIHVGGYPYPYFYDAGIFYRPYGSGYWISVSAPIGARVHALPAGYVTVGYGGHTYYRAHSTYYLYDGPARQYVVVEPPAGVPSLSGTAPATSDELFVYPARGQSEETTQRDRYECHLWSVSEVGVDPSLGETDDRDRADYRRALTACLEGRGYTVR
ncbi:MAG TPA: hypothetical protein VLT59_16395 [Steroidobacteraceae bacterium]|nr:hypothetical protein [Steroidobacteraceae bacterium]